MKFADLYAGAGGWTLGLSLAGHEPCFSAEIWPTANAVRNWNFGHHDGKVDVRALDPSSVPSVGLLVGSPPCTQFSYSNKGGGGDIEDGLVDVRKFLEVVRFLNPPHWVMENVPRLCGILENELSPGGRLSGFADLFSSIDEFDMSDWGVPQRRRRCIAGRYPRESLIALRGLVRPATLSEVVAGCAAGLDPTWGGSTAAPSDNDPGDPLSWEEARANLEKKRNHPIYNDMSFPDDPDRTARTVTATCTRVSRESIVVPSAHGGYRLLTPRESSALQSFPLAYEFAGGSRDDRVKMAGNAIPPLFTYMVGLAVAGKPFPGRLPSFSPASGPAPSAPSVRPRARRHRQGRAFRAAIAPLRFKSGMSFELRNGNGGWEMVLNAPAPSSPRTVGPAEIAFAASRLPVPRLPVVPSPSSIQEAWEAARDCPEHPYRVVDALSAAVTSVADHGLAEEAVRLAWGSVGAAPPAKALRLAGRLAGGLALAAAFNASLAEPVSVAA